MQPLGIARYSAVGRIILQFLELDGTNNRWMEYIVPGRSQYPVVGGSTAGTRPKLSRERPREFRLFEGSPPRQHRGRDCGTTSWNRLGSQKFNRTERSKGRGCQRPQAAPKTLQIRIRASFSTRLWPWSRGSCKLALRHLAALGQLWLAVPLPWPHRNLGFRRRFFLRERRCGEQGIALQRERGGWRGLQYRRGLVVGAGDP